MVTASGQLRTTLTSAAVAWLLTSSAGAHPTARQRPSAEKADIGMVFRMEAAKAADSIWANEIAIRSNGGTPSSVVVKAVSVVPRGEPNASVDLHGNGHFPGKCARTMLIMAERRCAHGPTRRHRRRVDSCPGRTSRWPWKGRGRCYWAWKWAGMGKARRPSGLGGGSGAGETWGAGGRPIDARTSPRRGSSDIGNGISVDIG